MPDGGEAATATIPNDEKGLVMAAVAKARFATPLPQSPRSDILEWRFPKPHSQYVLTGRSRAAWHTSFVIPQLNLLLDAGLCVNKVRPKHIFLTHGHSDHTRLLPAFVDRDDRPDVYCPVEIAGKVDAFVNASTILNSRGTDDHGGGYNNTSDGRGEAGKPEETAEKKWDGKGKRPRGATRLDTHITSGLRAGDTITLARARTITATAFNCDHTTPCLGFVFSQTSRRLKAEYQGLGAAEIKELRYAGVDITAPHSTPIFAFLGDTTATVLAAAKTTTADNDSDGDGSTGSAAQWGRWLRGGIPVVITECSFLEEKHRAQADKTKHTIWTDLEPVVRRWPATTFVLIHFSLRYEDDEIPRFFAGMPDPPGNIVVWADGGEG
ncbi:hypothetical protein RB595_006079 [Gaeumannomyces hyphopodioides]